MCVSSFCLSLLVLSESCRRQLAKMLKRLWVGMLRLIFIPALNVVECLESENDVSLRLIIIWCNTYSVALPLAVGEFLISSFFL